MQLHILGSGTPDPCRDRFGSAFLLPVDGDGLLVDCGPATTYKLACLGIAPTAVTHVFLTHHHFDHNVDLPCLALTWWDQHNGTQPPLHIYGPPTTRRFVDRLLGPDGAFYDDWRARIETPASQVLHQRRGGSLPRPPPRIEAHDVDPGAIAAGAGWTATAARVHHVEPWLASLAYRFQTPHGSIVFTGDAGASADLTHFCRQADVLVVCCAFSRRAGLHPEIAHCVTGVEDAAALAAEVKPKLVVLTHQSRGVAAPEGREQAVAAVSGAYAGRVVFADELTTVAW